MMEIIHAGKITPLTVLSLCPFRHNTVTCGKLSLGKVFYITFTPNESYCIKV